MSLERFIDAQARVWPTPLEEIQAGQKRSHWMWFLLRASRAGAAMNEITRAMLTHADQTPEAVLGPVDAMKLRSCLTLFQAAGGEALRVLYKGQPCEATRSMIGAR